MSKRDHDWDRFPEHSNSEYQNCSSSQHHNASWTSREDSWPSRNESRTSRNDSWASREDSWPSRNDSWASREDLWPSRNESRTSRNDSWTTRDDAYSSQQNNIDALLDARDNLYALPLPNGISWASTTKPILEIKEFAGCSLLFSTYITFFMTSLLLVSVFSHITNPNGRLAVSSFKDFVECGIPLIGLAIGVCMMIRNIKAHIHPMHIYINIPNQTVEITQKSQKNKTLDLHHIRADAYRNDNKSPLYVIYLKDNHQQVDILKDIHTVSLQDQLKMLNNLFYAART